MENSVYQEVVRATKPYLGPATARFVERQAQFHLHKDPEELTSDDVPKLAEWIKVSIAILTEDKSMVDSFEENINRLGKNI